MIRLYVDNAKKEQFRIEADEPITVVTGLTDAGRPLFIFEGIRDDVSVANAEENNPVLSYNLMEPHRYPTDTDLMVNADKEKVQVFVEDTEPDPEIVTPVVPETIDEAINNPAPVVEADVAIEREEGAVVITGSDDVTQVENYVEVPEETAPPVVPPPPVTQTPQNIAAPPTPPKRRPVPPTRRPGGGSGRQPRTPPKS